MGDTISLTTEEQRRGRILAHLVAGDLTIEEAAAAYAEAAARMHGEFARVA